MLIIIINLFAIAQPVWAQKEIGPEGHKLLWFLLILVAAITLMLFFFRPMKLASQVGNFLFVFRKKKITIELIKDRLYYPDELELTITNTGNNEVDLERPILIFSSIWLKRKFKLKGTNNASFYPLYLDKGQSHTLNIDLNRFYLHDKSLKKLPKVNVIVSEVNGQRLGSESVFLRKTLFKF